MTITRYDFTDTGLEPTGQGEWVRYEDHASHIEARDRSLEAALEAVARARDDAINYAAHVYMHGSGGDSWDFFVDAYNTILSLRTQPTPSVEPVTCPDCNGTGYCDGGQCWSCDVARPGAIAGGRNE